MPELIPKLPSKLYTATELGKEFGVHLSVIGKLAKAAGIHDDSTLVVRKLVEYVSPSGNCHQKDEIAYTESGKEMVRDVVDGRQAL